MRKNILLILSLCMAVSMLAQESNVKGIHPYKTAENQEIVQTYSHWSIIPRIGFNTFDGDFGSEKKHAVGFPTLGLGLEYTFTPVWGLGIEYTFDRYGVKGNPNINNDTAERLLRGYAHKADLYLSANLIGLFFPHAKQKIFGLNGIAGVGYGWYKSTIYYADDDSHGRGHTASYVNADGKVGPDAMKSYKGDPFIKFGVEAEFNLNRTLALGLRATYDYFMSDKLDGRGVSGKLATASKNNDGMWDISLGLRCKLEAVSKSHMCNFGSDAYNEAALANAAKDARARFQQEAGRDTVIIYRDTVIREIREVPAAAPAAREFSQYYYIYFQSGKATIDEEGLVTIQQVADRMAEDTSLYAVVTGFCDNTGSNSVNYTLGDKRAGNVIDELREEHGVPANHLYSAGVGKLVGRRSTAAYGPNRRAVIRLVDKETFKRLSGELDEKKSQRVEDDKKDAPAVQTVPLTISKALGERKNPFEGRTSEKARVDKTTTLSQLARQYYNNTQCWVYIFIANKDKISSPNSLQQGSELVIPELTEEEMKIDKETCLRLYGMAR